MAGLPSDLPGRRFRDCSRHKDEMRTARPDAGFQCEIVVP